VRVAWLHPHFQYWMGGTKFIFEVARRLRKEMDLTLFVLTADRGIRELFEKEGLEVIPVSFTSTHSLLFWSLFPYWTKRSIDRLKDEVKDYDLLISSMFPMNWIAFHFPKVHVQYCFEPFAFFHDQEMIKGFPFFKRSMLRALKFFYARRDIQATQRADKILTVNRGTACWIEKIYQRGSIPTYLGVDTDFFRTVTDEDLSRRYAGQKVIVHSTDYTPLKRTDVLIRALPEIRKEIPNLKLLVTHTVEDRKGIQKMIQLAHQMGVDSYLEMVGFVAIEKLPLYYSLADVAVYPGVGSGASAASLFVLEAMACETPVVRTSDSVEEVIDGESGLLFHPQDMEGMVRKIVHLLKDDDLRKRMGSMARERIKDVYNWESVNRIFREEVASFIK